MLRLTDGTGPTWASPLLRNGAWVIGVAAAFVLGRGIGRRLRGDVERRAVAAGAIAVAALVACERLVGQTLSLSTLDVRAGYALSAHAWTIPLSVLVVVAVHAAPAAALCAGLAPAVRAMPPFATGSLTAGMAAAWVGQLPVASIVLCRSADVTPAALALSALLRVAAEGLYVSLGLAAVLLLRRKTPPLDAAMDLTGRDAVAG